jgi:NAD(P)-dependent dehydrogenase (short-subunit alcohol dehydrogenase family)
MGEVDGKIAFATAKQFLIEDAAYVFITGQGQEFLDENVKQLNNKNVNTIESDISNMTDLDKLYSMIQKEKGYLHILFAHAEIFNTAHLECITEEQYDNCSTAM